tara:strand:- start:1160 stop:1363 length:204 start_codon:yes stop_codon:yes gene_type:complete
MKIKLKTSIIKDGSRFEKGDIIEVNESLHQQFIQKGWGESIDIKEAKPKKETKEMKAKNKETKNEAS